MALAVGIVGLPNVGKSTLFNALSNAGAESANYPFCTIEPNVGIVSVPDPRLDKLAGIYGSQKVIPTAVEFVDIAGLVEGASKGEGLGNKFLSHIREVDAIVHVVRCFEDENVVHVSGGVDPLADIEVIQTELLLRDIQSVEQRLNRAQKQAKSGDKVEKLALKVCEAILPQMNEGVSIRAMELDEEALSILDPLALLTAKPVLYVANVGEGQLDAGVKDPLVAKVAELAEKEGAEITTVCANVESELAGLEPEEQREFLDGMGLQEPGLHRLIRRAYALLNLITYFTAGPKETRAWTIRRQTLAPQAAGVIHSDFERGFIRAETIAWDKLLELGSEAEAKAAGQLRVEGKEYEVQDGDVMHFRFNV